MTARKQLKLGLLMVATSTLVFAAFRVFNHDAWHWDRWLESLIGIALGLAIAALIGKRERA